MEEQHKKPELVPYSGTLINYISGFILSLILTLTAYFLVQHHVATHHLVPSDNVAVAFLSALAIIQLIVQLVYFLHLDKQSKKRWNIVVLIFAVIVVFILVAGSLWIMYSLNYRSPTPGQVSHYIQSQGDL
jgi:cytochrome o ubiquinol oxidase subunit IV